MTSFQKNNNLPTSKARDVVIPSQEITDMEITVRIE